MFVFVYRCRNRCHPPVSSTPSSGSCLDTGIMNGADIVASVAMGARFTLIGRAYLYGLMAGGRQGVDRTIEILSSEIRRTMKLLGDRWALLQRYVRDIRVPAPFFDAKADDPVEQFVNEASRHPVFRLTAVR